MAAQARKVDALKTHKKGLMQQLFPREGETQPRLRFPEFQNAGEWERNGSFGNVTGIAEYRSSDYGLPMTPNHREIGTPYQSDSFTHRRSRCLTKSGCNQAEDFTSCRRWSNR